MTTEAEIVAACEQLLHDHPPSKVTSAEFLGAQFDAGLAWVHFPEGRGGRGASPKLQSIIDLRLQAAGVADNRRSNPIGIGMCAPTILTHGSDDQQTRYLKRIFTCEDVWCQLFSEPGAGSDVAALSSMAARDGDEWILNGQKVWTTLAHVARYGMVIARTDPEAFKHQGLTYFVVDMQAAGIEVRPLRQMTGEAEFNEVFFNDVRIPDSERLSDVGKGWHAALTTLMNERVAIGGAIPPREGGLISKVAELWRAQLAAGTADLTRRDHVAKLWVEAEVLRLTNIRGSQMRSIGTPGPEGSISKLISAELNKRLTEELVNLMGAEGMLYTEYTMGRPAQTMQFDCHQRAFLRMRANSIEGGTTEIMRNILGERVLGLPGDIRVDKDLPWSRVPR